MAVFKRPGSPKFYFKFSFNGKQIFKSAKTTSESVALDRERKYRAQLEREALTPEDLKPLPPAPTLKEFARIPAAEDLGGEFWARFATNEYANSPNTLMYYRQRLRILLSFEPLADTRLNDIDEKVIDDFVSWRRAAKMKQGTINCDLTALRAVLKRAKRWKLIKDYPEIELPQVKSPGRAITLEEEQAYLAAAADFPDHQDFVMLLIDTAMEPNPAANLDWSDVYFGRVRQYRDGYIHNRCTKNDYRERDLPMSKRLAFIMKERWLRMGRPKAGPVFPSARGGRERERSFRDFHGRLWVATQTRPALSIKYFRLYDLRHTALTRLRDSGADAHDLKQFAGWANLRMADRYIHVDDKSKAIAMDRLNAHLEQLAQLSKDAVN